MGSDTALPRLEQRLWPCDAGHKIIALVADCLCDPRVRNKVSALLQTDKTGLTEPDLAHEATWADKYRASGRSTAKQRYDQTQNWHPSRRRRRIAWM